MHDNAAQEDDNNSTDDGDSGDGDGTIIRDCSNTNKTKEAQVSTTELVEVFMEKMSLPFERKGDTWTLQPRTIRVTRIGIQLVGDVLTFSTPVRKFDTKSLDLFEQILRWNATQMLHAAYGIEGSMIVLSGALEVENLDFNEFQAMIDDISLGIDSHFTVIREAA